MLWRKMKKQRTAAWPVNLWLRCRLDVYKRQEFIQKVRSISQVRQQEAAKELKRKVAKERRRSTELDVLIKKLYETYALSLIHI